MGRMELRAAIFNLISYLTKYELSDRAKQLVIYYFNQSDEDTAYERALDAISKYYAGDMPNADNMTEKYKKLLTALKTESDVWDSE